MRAESTKERSKRRGQRENSRYDYVRSDSEKTRRKEPTPFAHVSASYGGCIV
jgi:hypothetical protein